MHLDTEKALTALMTVAIAGVGKTVPEVQSRVIAAIRGTGDYGMSGPGSVLLEASKLHHLGPLLSFVGDELSEVRDRAKERLAAEIGHPCLHRGIRQRQVDFSIEPLDDLGRRSLGSTDA